MATADGDAVTFRDAITNVEFLDEIVLPDSHPCIEAASFPLQYRINFDTNFQDRGAFITGVARYNEEATRQSEFNEMLNEGLQHAITLYTWRCCSRSVPMAKSNEQPNRLEIYNTTVEVMYPEVEKLTKFMYFQKQAVKRICEEIRGLCHHAKSKDFVSEATLLTLAKLVNMFAVLDELKNMKASIKNDYSAFRRASQFYQGMTDSQTSQESHNLSMFLAKQNSIREDLRKELQGMEGYEEILADVMNLCLHMFDDKLYTTPSEKHMLVKVLAFGVYLIDGETVSVTKLDQKKRISIARIDRIFKQLEIVPLYGDMNITPFAFVQKSHHFDGSKWPNAMQKSSGCQVNLVERLERIRDEHTHYITHLARIHNEMAVYENNGPRSDSENKELKELALQGIRVLCSWTCDVIEMIAWKLLNPTDPHHNHTCPPEAENYEKVTRYNYTDEEKGALIEVISMIKGLHMLLSKMETEFSHAIRKCVYAELQEFVQVTLREPLRKAQKGKKEYLRSIIQSVRETAADYMLGYDPQEDLSGKGHKKDYYGSAGDVRTPRKVVAPSSTQLYMIRTMLESLTCDRTSGKRTVRKELDGSHLMAIEEFLQSSYFWPLLLNFSESLEQCCDLSQLWFREFYLEMTMGSRIQFPIEMSMPWILTSQILNTKDPGLMECVLYQLDLYNDSAQCALTRFKKQFLYDEIEAEVNLCFDQFIYKLSDQIFMYYKQMAACSILDKRFKQDMKRFDIPGYFEPPPVTCYHILLQQRHFQLLGRSIDLNRLVTQRINSAVKSSLDVAISRFESNDLTDIMELDGLLSLNKRCHKMLKEVLPGLTDFKDVFSEANENVSARHGRVTRHVIWELSQDFLPYYCYNSSTNRITRWKDTRAHALLRQLVSVEFELGPQFSCVSSAIGACTCRHQIDLQSLNQAFNNIFTMYRSFVGMPHFGVIAKLLGYDGIAMLFEQLLKMCQDRIQVVLLEYCEQLMRVMPKLCKLQSVLYGSPGILEYYVAQLQNIISYPDLKITVLQAFRELGNMILFCMLMEQALSREEILDLQCAAPFTNVLPKPYCKEGEKPEQKVKRMEQKYSKIQVVPTIEKFGTEQQIASVHDGDILTKERLCCGLSLFDVILSRIRDCLAHPFWDGHKPHNGVMHVEECSEFHRLWSAIQFVYTMPTMHDGDVTVEELYGEGLNWAGCTLISLLRQQKRFEALDFSYHLLRVQRLDGKDDEKRLLSRMAVRIGRFQVLNNEIFAVLNKFLGAPDGGDGEEGLVAEQIRCFPPPIHESLTMQ